MRERMEMLGIGQTELSRWLGESDRTIRRYLSGERGVPPSLDLLLEYLEDRPEALVWFRDRAAKKTQPGSKAKAAKGARPKAPAEDKSPGEAAPKAEGVGED